MLTGPLCAAARALVEVSRPRLADKSCISESVIEDFENGVAEPDDATIKLLKSKLEELGAAFIPENQTMGVGVRLLFNSSVTKRLATLENEGGLSRTDDVP